MIKAFVLLFLAAGLFSESKAFATEPHLVAAGTPAELNITLATYTFSNHVYACIIAESDFETVSVWDPEKGEPPSLSFKESIAIARNYARSTLPASFEIKVDKVTLQQRIGRWYYVIRFRCTMHPSTDGFYSIGPEYMDVPILMNGSFVKGIEMTVDSKTHTYVPKNKQ